jgi:F-type H+-transporting ATPase subunit epsilon
MADTFLLEISSPERQLIKEQVIEAQIPGSDGYLGILPGHAALVSRLKPGVLSYVLPGGSGASVAIHGGFLEVADDHARVLVDGGVKAEEVDLAKAQEEYVRAQQAVQNLPAGMDIADALNEAFRAEAQIEAARRLKS